MTDGLQDARTPPKSIGVARIAIGLAAGVLLWLLNEAADAKGWAATQPGLFGALAAVALFLPFVLVGGLSALRPRTLAIWAAGATVLLALLGWHDLTRRGDLAGDPWLAAEMMVFVAGGLFVANELVAGGDAERRLIARYPTYFETAWKHGVQLALSAAFVGVFWLLLYLGAALFRVIGIEAIEELLRKPWFGFPASGAMFAAAVQLTDVRVGLIRGIRTVALTLLSWLLPVLTVLAAAFLLALPFTGLEPLWKTRSAAGILLSAAATLIVLINAAYQDGEPEGIVPLVLRATTRLAGLLLAPMIALAGYALWLRIGQHGLTPDRIVGVACVVAGAVYAGGYAFAALRLGRWMRRLEATNIIAAFVVIGLLLAIFTPIADPARLSVSDQLGRLKAGEVSAERFDYLFLRFDGGRYGQDALRDLKAAGGVAGAKATEVLARKSRYEPVARQDAVEPGDPRSLEVVWPRGAALPDGFVRTGWWQGDAEGMACAAEKPCPAALLDLNSDGQAEVIVAGKNEAVVFTSTGAGWRVVRQLGYRGCPGFADALRRGDVRAEPSPWRDLVVGGQSIAIDGERDCNETKGPRTPTAPPPAIDGRS
ncbi:MAG: DUF4153 domain-containing protein [Caulobacter sp.]|nr:DUF4153 domain-containing protein [Caulobacter sp.]